MGLRFRTTLGRWIVPSLADLLLAALVLRPYLLPGGLEELLSDASVGMHIRTGDLIRSTGSLPHTDPFSFALPGKEWFAWELDLLYPGIAQPRGIKRFSGGEPAAVVEHMRKRGERALGMLNDHLGKAEWLVGKAASLADVAVAVDCAYVDEADLSLDAFPAVKAWAAKVAKLPGWKAPKDLLPMPAA